MTGTALRLLVRDYLGIPTGYARCTDANIDDYAMEAMMELAEAALPDSLRMISSGVISTAAGTPTYSLGALGIPLRILHVSTNGAALKHCQPYELDLLSEDWLNAAHGASTHYMVELYASSAPTIRLWPTPASVAALNIRYIRSPAALSGSNIDDFPVYMQYAIARYAAWRCAVKLSEVLFSADKCALWLQRWESDKAEFVQRCNEANPLQSLVAGVLNKDRMATQ